MLTLFASINLRAVLIPGLWSYSPATRIRPNPHRFYTPPTKATNPHTQAPQHKHNDADNSDDQRNFPCGRRGAECGYGVFDGFLKGRRGDVEGGRGCAVANGGVVKGEGFDQGVAGGERGVVCAVE